MVGECSIYSRRPQLPQVRASSYAPPPPPDRLGQSLSSEYCWLRGGGVPSESGCALPPPLQAGWVRCPRTGCGGGGVPSESGCALPPPLSRPAGSGARGLAAGGGEFRQSLAVPSPPLSRPAGSGARGLSAGGVPSESDCALPPPFPGRLGQVPEDWLLGEFRQSLTVPPPLSRPAGSGARGLASGGVPSESDCPPPPLQAGWVRCPRTGFWGSSVRVLTVPPPPLQAGWVRCPRTGFWGSSVRV